MSNPCEDCDRLQEVLPKGNASIRPPFQQPTMYDHLSSFSKFKEEKILSKQLKTKEEDLLKFNKNFTNLELDKKNDEILEKFSTQDIAKFRCNLKEGRFHQKMEKDEPEDLWKKQEHEVKAAASLTTILRTPVICPVSKCGRTIGVTSVLSHFLRDHNEDLTVECMNLYAEGRSLLLFDWDKFNFGENVCLGVLSYGGVEK
ncbi:uncharacterized protein LOC129908967 [Episyrphus balteatus]|uniref:uncharacterized protein LOC129908967 n=1 Tax=Episyrphus balteatus TaxID=286459 RepID=UPI0024858FAC|nr:uncharacterized protein LOC129908967 [Episyrphus balteatus]